MPPLAALALASFATGTQSFVFGGLLDEMAREFGVSVGAVGQLASVYAVTVALGAPIAAAVAGRFERRGVMVWALLAMAAANLLAMLSVGFSSLLWLRMAAALTACVITPLSSAAAMAVAPPEQRGRAFAIVTGGITIALVLGVPMGSVVGAAFGWRASFGLAAGLVLVAAVVLRLSLPRLVPPAAADRRPIGEALRLRAVQGGLAITLLGFTAIFTVAAYLGPIVTRSTGLSGAAIGGFQAAVGLGAILGIILGGRIAGGSHSGKAPAAIFLVMLVSLLAYAPLLVLGPQVFVGLAGAWLAALVLLGAGALFTLIPLVQVRLAAAAPTAGPVLFGLNGSMVFAGQGAGALLGGMVADGLGYAAIGPAGAMVAALALLVVAATAAPRGGN